MYDYDFPKWYKDNWKDMVNLSGQSFALKVWQDCRKIYEKSPNVGEAPSSAERSIYPVLADGWQDFTKNNLPDFGDLIAILPAPEQCTKPYIVVYSKSLEWIDGDKWYRLPSIS